MRTAIDHRDAILQSAAKLFARKPFHEVLMDDVADHAGIAKGTIYRYFPNKEELFATLSMLWLEQLVAGITEVAQQHGRPIVRLRRMVERLAEMIQENRDFFQVMQRHECDLWAKRYSEFLSRRSQMREQFAGVIKEAQAAGEVRAYDPVVAADLMLGMVRSVVRFTDPVPSPDRGADLILSVFLNGLSTAPVTNRNGNGNKPGGKRG